MLRLNDAVVSNAAPTGTVARPSKKTARNSPQVYSRTRFYAIDVHRACKVRLYPAKISSRVSVYIVERRKEKRPQPSPVAPWPIFRRSHLLQYFRQTRNCRNCQLETLQVFVARQLLIVMRRPWACVGGQGQVTPPGCAIHPHARTSAPLAQVK